MNLALSPSTLGAIQNLGGIACPAGMLLAAGGTRAADLSFSLPPDIPLDTHRPAEILTMLDYAGIRYRSADSFAAAFGVSIFEAAREFADRTGFDQVSFDWDHTLSNYKIFDNVLGVFKTRMRRTPLPESLAQTPMTAIEVARPFMHELAFGMMAGYAGRQGLSSLDQWQHYTPQVGLATHTWPDRIGVLAQHFMRLIPLMEGLIPGSPRMYEKMTDGSARSIVHLHHFLGYADALMTRFQSGGFEVLSATEQDEVMGYCEDGKGHHRKPLGALEQRGWPKESLLHFDDSTKVVEDIEKNPSSRIRAIHVRQPHSSFFRNVQEWNKIAVSRLWSSQSSAAVSTVRGLARMEWDNATIAAIVGALNVFSSEEALLPDLRERSQLPDGVVLRIHETPTTLGEFWRYYVEPTNTVKVKIRHVVKSRGGLASIRKDYQRIRAQRNTPPQLTS